MTAVKYAYLDHNASAPLLPEARLAMLETMDLIGNPSSVHGHGRALRARIETARKAVAELAGANGRDVVFTGSATEALTQGIVGGARAFAIDEIIVSAGDHLAALKAADATGLPVTRIGLLPSGEIDLDHLRDAIGKADGSNSKALVAVHLVNNETGVIQPLAEIEKLLGPTPHILVVDAVQAFGKLPLEFSARSADMMAVTAHKIGGPAGVGALLTKPHCDAVRLIPGGGQELGRRGGTESATLIAGFGAAAQTFPTAYEKAATGDLIKRIEAELPEDIIIFGHGANRTDNVINFAVPGFKSAVAMMALDLDGVSISAGSACSSGKVGRSHVLAAMGVSDELAECALRVSLGWNSTQEDVTQFLGAFEKALTRHQIQKGRAA